MVVNVSGLIGHNYGPGLTRIVEMALLTLSIVSFLLSLFFLGNESVALNFIKPEVQNLKPVGLIKSKQGRSTKRTAVDMLWIPTSAEEIVYEGDTIITDKESLVEIQLSQTATIFIEPRSLVKIKSKDGLPLIKIREGQVKLEYLKDEILMIQKGAVVEDVLIQKGTYFIRNDNASGIQITSFDHTTRLTRGKGTQSKVKSKVSDQAMVDDKGDIDSYDQTSEADPIVTNGSTDIEFDLPTPKPDTLFLVQSKSSLWLGSQMSCPDNCKMEIYFNGNSIQTFNFMKNDFTLIELDSDTLKYGPYTWTFDTETSTYQSQFQIKPYTTFELSRALSGGLPIEILNQN